MKMDYLIRRGRSRFLYAITVGTSVRYRDSMSSKPSITALEHVFWKLNWKAKDIGVHGSYLRCAAQILPVACNQVTSNLINHLNITSRKLGPQTNNTKTKVMDQHYKSR